MLRPLANSLTFPQFLFAAGMMCSALLSTAFRACCLSSGSTPLDEFFPTLRMKNLSPPGSVSRCCGESRLQSQT
jgi:hypothetical protein